MKELKVSWKTDPDEGYIIFIEDEKVYTATTREEKDNFIAGVEKAHREATKIGMRVDGFIDIDNPPDEEIIRVPPEYIKESGCAIPLLILVVLTLVIFL